MKPEEYPDFVRFTNYTPPEFRCHHCASASGRLIDAATALTEAEDEAQCLQRELSASEAGRALLCAEFRRERAARDSEKTALAADVAALRKALKIRSDEAPVERVISSAAAFVQQMARQRLSSALLRSELERIASELEEARRAADEAAARAQAAEERATSAENELDACRMLRRLEHHRLACTIQSARARAKDD
jgi:chromosome segregation ATPase